MSRIERRRSNTWRCPTDRRRRRRQRFRGRVSSGSLSSLRVEAAFAAHVDAANGVARPPSEPSSLRRNLLAELEARNGLLNLFSHFELHLLRVERLEHLAKFGIVSERVPHSRI